VLRDLSRLKALEAECGGERLAALGQMALALAHEIRNPLGAIRGVAQLLAAELGEGPYREHVAVMLGEIDRVNRVMEALLDVGRPMRLSFAAVNLHQLLRAGLPPGRPGRPAHGVQILRRYDPSLPALWADEDRLTQVFRTSSRTGSRRCRAAAGSR
jgi:nitrogen-specific signal transduction histidine kinase